MAASSANFLMPSCSFSNAHASSSSAQRKAASLSTKDSFGIGSACAAVEASSDFGIGSVEFLSCSSKEGARLLHFVVSVIDVFGLR